MGYTTVERIVLGFVFSFFLVSIVLGILGRLLGWRPTTGSNRRNHELLRRESDMEDGDGPGGGASSDDLSSQLTQSESSEDGSGEKAASASASLSPSSKAAKPPYPPPRRGSGGSSSSKKKKTAPAKWPKDQNGKAQASSSSSSASASRRPRQDRKQSLATLNEDKSFRSASFKSQSSSSNQRVNGSLDRTGTPRDPSVQSTGSSSTAPGEYRRIYKPDQGVPGGGRHGGGRESSSQRYEPAAI